MITIQNCCCIAENKAFSIRTVDCCNRKEQRGTSGPSAEASSSRRPKRRTSALPGEKQRQPIFPLRNTQAHSVESGLIKDDGMNDNKKERSAKQHRVAKRQPLVITGGCLSKGPGFL